jgi:tetratricopeptide (TPR) repeat protein
MFVARRGFVMFVLILTLSLITAGQDSRAAVIERSLAGPDELSRLGKFAEAEDGYRALLKTDPKLVLAKGGLVRAMLGQQKIDEALDTVNAALTAEPESAPLLAVRGDVQFRQGEMSDAEVSYLAAQKADPKEVHAHLGLAALYNSYSLYRKAYDQLKIARDIAPGDSYVQLAWIRMLPRELKQSALESYLAAPNHKEEAKAFTSYLEFVKTKTGQGVHSCRLVSKAEQTETKLEAFWADGARRSRAVALATSINDQKVLLPLDTGASGIMVSRRLAEKARLPRISEAYVAGWGDHGPRSGYRAVVNTIRIGELEFQDCVVVVADVPGAEGVIGPDVFASYLIDIDLAQMRLRLSPLPKRPEDAVAPTALNSEVEEETGADGEVSLGQTSAGKNSSDAEDRSTPVVPKDRYIAPEMANWTRVFRFGHMLLIPTIVSDSKPMLFLLDTGAVGSVLSLHAAQLVSKVHSENRVHLRGLSGAVSKCLQLEERYFALWAPGAEKQGHYCRRSNQYESLKRNGNFWCSRLSNADGA